MLARYGLGEVIQDEQDRRAGLTQLSCGHDIGGGITEYRMRLTPESRAVVEAAINTLSRPAVGCRRTGRHDRTGVRDPRTVEQRRGDALVTCAAAPSPSAPPPRRRPAGRPRTSVVPLGVKATVLVTIGYDDLAPGPAPAPWSAG